MGGFCFNEKLTVSDTKELSENMAKMIVRNYHKGFGGLHDYICAVEYYSSKHPDATMIDLENWSKEANSD